MLYGIRVCTSLEEGELYPLFDNHEITLGRSPTNNIFIRDKNVSRVHCQIVVIEERCMLTDLQSTNGVYVNGEQVTERHLLAGDEIRLGTTLLELEEIAEDGGTITDTALMR